jgi:hypothetical protein
MFDEPEEDPERRPFDPAERARTKSDEFRMHAELAAVFEGIRKFDANLDPTLSSEVAREVQKGMARLEKSRPADTPLIRPDSFAVAAELLNFPTTKSVATNDYHIHRRPGETMIIRWLAGEQVDSFYTRLQAHFDSGLNQYKEDQRSSHGWKQDEKTQAYIAALDLLEVKMEERYLRPIIRDHGLFVLSTQSADEMDILHLCDYIMGVPAIDVVGRASAPPPDEATERDRAWFFKLFALRGKQEGIEQMCFFTYLQKSDDSDDWGTSDDEEQ